MKRKLSLRSIVALLLAFALAFVGVNPVGVEAEEFTEITWSDFNLTVGNTYTGATDESSASSNAGTYSAATNMNNTVFIGDVIMANGSEMRYGGNDYNQGFRMQVIDDAFVLTSGQTYIYPGNQSGSNEYVNEDNGTLTVKVPKTRASEYGLKSFANEQFTLKIQMTGWDGNTGFSGMSLSVWINDVVVEENLSVASGSFGTYFCACVYGSVTPALQLNKISWEDFGLTIGNTYTGATDESSAPSNTGKYTGATSMNNTEFAGDVIFSDNSEIRYGGDGYNTGIKIKIQDGALKLSGSLVYLYNPDVVNEIVIPESDAGQYGLTSFADEKFTLKIRVTGWDGNTGWSGMTAGVWVNDVAIVESISMGSSNFGNNFCACVYGSVTIPEPERQFTSISWADFDGAVYGQTYDKTDVLLNYKGSSFNDTAFEDDIIFQPGASLLYAVQNSWHGLEIGVTTDGGLKLHGSCYSDGFNALSYTYPASQFGLTTLANAKITLRVEMWNVTAKTADVKVYVNGIQVGNKIVLTKNEGDAVAGIGTGIAPCPYGGTIPFTIPRKEVELTPITWADFGGTYGDTYTSIRTLEYSGESLNNTSFEGDIIFSAGAMMRYANVNGYFGMRMGVDATSGKFFIKGAGPAYINGWDQTLEFEPSTFNLTAFADTRFTLKIEMQEVTDMSALVSVYINGIQAGTEFTLTANDGHELYKLGKVIGFCVEESDTSITILEVPDKPLDDLYYDLAEGGYTVPSGAIEVFEKSVVDGAEEWAAITVNAEDVLETIGDYKVRFRDGTDSYVQEVILFQSGVSDLKTYMRTLKHVQGVQDDVYKKADVRMCDVNSNNEIEQEDENIIRQILLGLFS